MLQYMHHSSTNRIIEIIYILQKNTLLVLGAVSHFLFGVYMVALGIQRSRLSGFISDLFDMLQLQLHMPYNCSNMLTIHV